ncbi:MAG: acyl-homoserine-lactone synthase [Sedimenticola sp.]
MYSLAHTSHIDKFHLPQPFTTGMETKTISLQHNNLLYHADCSDELLDGSYKLRNEVFDEEKSWVTGQDGLEIDQFDATSTTSVVTNEVREVVATSRAVDSRYNWMSETCFGGIFRKNIQDIKIPGVKEISRVCISKYYRNNYFTENIKTFDFLLAGMLLENKMQGTRGAVIITGFYMYKFLEKNNIKIHMLSKKVIMPDRYEIAIFYVDIEQSFHSFKPLKYLGC